MCTRRPSPELLKAAAKAATWQLLTIITGTLVLYLMMGGFVADLEVIVANAVLEVFLFVAHERLWDPQNGGGLWLPSLTSRPDGTELSTTVVEDHTETHTLVATETPDSEFVPPTPDSP
ncbi:MAG: DUF2061 domain-containing protein [Nitrospinaceae bacterium]|nr:DUF2061 domain-containing protein [Nitrospinaceae bacterium]